MGNYQLIPKRVYFVDGKAVINSNSSAKEVIMLLPNIDTFLPSNYFGKTKEQIESEVKFFIYNLISLCQ